MTTKVTNVYNLKLTPSQFGQSSLVVNCSQYDSLFRVIQFNLYNGNAVYSIPEGSVVTIRGTKKDNTGFEYECDFYNNVVTFPIQQQITIFPGKVPAELRIVNDGEIIGSWNFLFLVEESPLTDDTIISETDLPLLQSALQAASEAENYKNLAQQSADNASESEQNASESEANALTYSQNAQTSANSASQSEANALTYSQNASESASEAQGFAQDAEDSATQSADSATSASQSASQAQTIADNISDLVDEAQGYASQSLTNAQNSAQSASQASQSATNASQSASNAQTYASNANTSAQNASSSATSAQTYAGNASTSATQSASSATASAQSATNAQTYANNASASATQAQGYATNASDSATASAQSATNAQESAELARQYAESLTIDTELSDTSTNAVQNKVITEALDTKANIDGYYEDLSVGNAEQLISTTRSIDQVPYLFRTSGGSKDVGDREFDSIVGGSIAWNQLFENGDFSDGTNGWSGNSATLTVTDGVARATLTGSAWNNDIRQSTVPVTDGHVYLFSALVRLSSADFSVRFRNPGGQFTLASINETEWTLFESLMKCTTAFQNGFALSLVQNGTSYSGEWFEAQNMNCFDLTQMFGSTIADYVYNLEQSSSGAGVNWFRKHFPKSYYEYDSGSMKSVEGLESHDMVGFNQWDEEWEVGSYTLTGNKNSSTTEIRNKNFIPVLPNTQYYFNSPTRGVWYAYDDDKNLISRNVANPMPTAFTTPSNCHYINFYLNSAYGTTYKNDICINISWSGYRNGEYEPYVKHSYPLDSSLTLRGIPKLDSNNDLYYDGDTYESDGTVTRKYGIVDLGTLIWSSNGAFAYPVMVSIALNNVKLPSANSQQINCMSVLAPSKSANRVGAEGDGIGIETTGKVRINYANMSTDPATFKTAMSGIYLIYELATPTTETATPYTNPQIVNDFGTEEYVTDSIVPVGHNTEYLVNLRDKLQHLPDLADSDGYYVIQQTDHQMSLVHFRIPQAPVSTDGTFVLKAVVSGGNVTYQWVEESA